MAGRVAVGAAAVALSLSLLLPWYTVRRPTALGPAEVDGWQAFARVDATLFAAAVAALLAPTVVPPLVARLVAVACGLGAALVAAWRIVDLPVIPPLATASPAEYVRADSVEAGAYAALACGLALAAVAAWGARRAWSERRRQAWPSPTTMVVGLTAAAAVLRFAALGEQSYWYDEFATVDIVGRDLDGAVDAYLGTESTPPLYYLLAWPWAQLLGTGELALRSLSALVGIATVPLVYLAGRRLVSARAGVIAAAIVAVNPTLVWYAQEARAYALLVFLAAVTLVLLARALAAPTARNVALWALAAALALLTHYYAVFLIAAEAVVLGRRALRERPAALVGAVVLPVAVLALLPVIGEQDGGDRTSWIAGIPLGDRLGDIARELVSANTLVINANTGEPGGGAGYLAVLAIVVAAVVVARRRSSRAGLPLLLGAAALALPLALVPLGIDYFLDRNLLAAWVPLSIALAAALAALPRRACAAALACVLGAGLAVDVDVATDPSLQRAAWRDGVKALGDAEAGRAIVVVPAFARGIVPYYGADATQLSQTGIRTRELVLFGNYTIGTPVPVGAFAPAVSRQLPQIGTVVLRAPEPVLLTPETVSELGIDAEAVLVEPSERAEAWLAVYAAREAAWRAALAAAAAGDADAALVVLTGPPRAGALRPAPADVPDAEGIAARVAAADEAGAAWAQALVTGDEAAIPAARRFDAALRRVPAAVGPGGAEAITREMAP